jgi:peroxiredoxin
VFWLDNGKEVKLDELLEDGPVLLLFYLFDWSPT